MELTEIIEKARKEIQKGGSVCMAFSGEIEAIRGTSSRLDTINPEQIIGVYNGKSTDDQIIEDTIWYFESRNKKQAEQSKRFAQAVGLDS